MSNSVRVRLDLFDRLAPEMSVHFMYDIKLYFESEAGKEICQINFIL